MNAYAPAFGFYHDFLPQGQRFCTFFLPRGWGTCLFKKIPQGLAWGRWSGLELTDTLRKYWNFSLVLLNPKTPFESSYYLYVKKLIGKQLVYNQCLNCNQRT